MDRIEKQMGEMIDHERRVNASLEQVLLEKTATIAQLESRLKDAQTQRDLLKQRLDEEKEAHDNLGDVWSNTIRRVHGQPLFPFRRIIEGLWSPVANHLSAVPQYVQIMATLRHQIEIAFWQIEDLETQLGGKLREDAAVGHLRAQVKRLYKENQELRRRLRVHMLVEDPPATHRFALGKALARFSRFVSDFAIRPVEKMFYPEVIEFRGPLRAQILEWADKIRAEDEAKKEEEVERV